ncbi:DUF5677 domain-containing protein [Ralstonia pseudosolanacearum]
MAEASDQQVHLDAAAAWLTLARDTHSALARAALKASVPPIGLEIWSPQAVAVRVLMRTCGNLEAVVVLAGQGLVAEARTLARSLIENAFAVAALVDMPVDYVDMLKADSQRSRRNQGAFILEHMPDSGGDRDRLRQVIDGIDRSLKLINQKELALRGTLSVMYLAYQRLSDDAAHVSALSLERHATRSGGGWIYRCEPGTPEENAPALYYALMAALAVGAGVNEVLAPGSTNAAFMELTERLDAMPPVQTI